MRTNITPKENRTYTYKQLFCRTDELEKAHKDVDIKSIRIYKIVGPEDGIQREFYVGETLLKDL